MTRHGPKSYVDHYQYLASPEGRLEDVLGSGDYESVRKLLDEFFWNNWSFKAEWQDLKIALWREDRQMMQLLVTWGAEGPKTQEDLKGLRPEKMATYIKFLRRYGVDTAVMEKAPAEKEDLSRCLTLMPSSSVPSIGEMVPGQGIYVGQCEPLDQHNRSLGRIFNIFAAPEDLPGGMSYGATVLYVYTLGKWHGFEGTPYETDSQIYAALKDGSYGGGWIIPTLGMLSGNSLRGWSQLDSLYQHREQGALKNTFGLVSGYRGRYYWSSTRKNGYQWVARFSDRMEGGYDINHANVFNCRLVRLVEVSGVKKKPENKATERRFASNGGSIMA